MENIPFGSSDDEEKKPLNIFESTGDDDDEKDEIFKSKKKKKSSKTKRSIFFGKESSEGEQTKKEEDKSSIFGDGEGSIFSGLLKRKDEAETADKSAVESDIEEFVGEAEVAQVQDEFQEVVSDKAEYVESAKEKSTGVEAEELSADATFLSAVGDRMAEGLPPTEAIETAKSETIEEVSTESGTDFVGSLAPETFEPAVHPTVETEIPEVETESPEEIIPPTLTPLEDIPGAVGFPRPVAESAPPSADEIASRPDVTPESSGISRMNSLYYRDGRRGGLLMGGALGYLFGRRRGRIKTESRLEPVISKKEKEVDALKGKLEQSEKQVRETVAEKTANPNFPENIPAHTLEERLQEQHDREEKFAATLEEEPQVQTTTELPKVIKEKPEQVGDIEIEATKLARDASDKIEKPLSIEKGPGKAEVATMSIPELLIVADKIHIESTSLREIYEDRRIDAGNLRRVVKDYLSGGNYNKLLRQSLEAVELQQELRNEVKVYDEPKTENTVESVQDEYPKKDPEKIPLPVGVGVSQQPIYDSDLNPEEQLNDKSPQQKLLQGSQQNPTNGTNKGTPVLSSMAVIGGVIVGIILVAALIFYNSGG